MRSQNHSSAVMNQRSIAPEALEYFPTPPWATRALMEDVLGTTPGLKRLSEQTCIEPCCGEGHMIRALDYYFRSTTGSDVFDYSQGYAVKDVLDPAADFGKPDWMITNPPFSLAAEIAQRFIGHGCSVALLLRLNWCESDGRYRNLFSVTPPHIVAPFAERVPMIEGAYDPEASSATAYAWFIWFADRPMGHTEMKWIPPGRARAHFRFRDAEMAKPGEAKRRADARKAKEAGITPASADLFGGGL